MQELNERVNISATHITRVLSTRFVTARVLHIPRTCLNTGLLFQSPVQKTVEWIKFYNRGYRMPAGLFESPDRWIVRMPNPRETTISSIGEHVCVRMRYQGCGNTFASCLGFYDYLYKLGLVILIKAKNSSRGNGHLSSNSKR